MRISCHTKRPMIGALLMLSFSTAFASVCDQPSPLQNKLGDAYWEAATLLPASDPAMSNITLAESSSALDLLTIFYDKQYVKAAGSRHICKGAEDQRRLVSFISKLRIASDKPRRKHDSTLRIDYIEQSESKEDKISFDQSLTFDLPNVEHWRVTAKNAIATSQVQRQRTVHGASVLSQIDTELEKTSHGLQVSQTRYINGLKNTWAVWTLSH